MFLAFQGIPNDGRFFLADRLVNAFETGTGAVHARVRTDGHSSERPQITSSASPLTTRFWERICTMSVLDSMTGSDRLWRNEALPHRPSDRHASASRQPVPHRGRHSSGCRARTRPGVRP
jgi:hypothetical protein